VIVVSNSSPLVALARISRLNLLASIHKRILIPAQDSLARFGLPKL
jgi:predicted nucleic acid-binding protein